MNEGTEIRLVSLVAKAKYLSAHAPAVCGGLRRRMARFNSKAGGTEISESRVQQSGLANEEGAGSLVQIVSEADKE